MISASTKFSKETVKSYLRKIPLLIAVKRKIRRLFNPEKGTTKLNVLKEFPLYAPNSAGTYKSKAPLTIQTINQVMPVLSSFSTAVTGRRLGIVDIKDSSRSAQELECANELKKYLDKYGSDKADTHQNYHYLYGAILEAV